VRYAVWVARVFDALAEQAPDEHHRTGLPQLADALGLGPLTENDFASHEGPAQALMTAMYDLHGLGLVWFENVDYGNYLTPNGRDLAGQGFDHALAPAFAIPLTERERTFLARLYERSRAEEAAWADLVAVDAEQVYAQAGLDRGDLGDLSRRLTMLGDLKRKGLVEPASPVLGNTAYRPTFLAAALLAEGDPRFRGRQAGLIDWSQPTPGFEIIEGRLADLKLALAAAVTDDDLSDVGRRCRDIAADAVDIVFRPAMVPEGTAAPSRQDAEARLRLYLAVRAPGDNYEEYRRFLRAALALAHARTHSARTGRAAATASAQGLLSFIRALQALERSTYSGEGGSGRTD
jgi:hypothetical protein